VVYPRNAAGAASGTGAGAGAGAGAGGGGDMLHAANKVVARARKMPEAGQVTILCRHGLILRWLKAVVYATLLLQPGNVH